MLKHLFISDAMYYFIFFNEQFSSTQEAIWARPFIVNHP